MYSQTNAAEVQWALICVYLRSMDRHTPDHIDNISARQRPAVYHYIHRFRAAKHGTPSALPGAGTGCSFQTKCSVYRVCVRVPAQGDRCSGFTLRGHSVCIYGVHWRTAAPRLTDVCAVCATRVTVCTVGADRVAVIVAGVSAGVCWSLAAPFQLADICAVCVAHFTVRTVSADNVTVTVAGFARVLLKGGGRVGTRPRY